MVSSVRSLLRLFTATTVLLSIAASSDPPKNRLHIFLPEDQLLKVNNDKVYVRVYEAVPGPADGASTTTFPSAYEQHDTYLDGDGRVIIYSGIDIESRTRVGVGDPRKQLELISKYQTQQGSGENPLIRSFLVDYDVLRNVLNPQRIATENEIRENVANEKLSLNVDQEYDQTNLD